MTTIAALTLLAFSQQSSQPSTQSKQVLPVEEAASIVLPTRSTKHTLHLPSGDLSYTATTGQILLRGENDEVECRMFYVAYTKDGEPAGTRPVTFAFNGGPGSATIWLHLGALGPKRAPMNDDGSLPKPPYAVVENSDSWLDFSDLVLVDAPGTGYSRLVKPEFSKKYFGVRQDIQAFTKFIHGWLSEHHRWSSPLFVAGESYGGIRGSGLSLSLFEDGIALNGFISVSGTSNFMTLDNMRGNDITYIGFFPSMAACAFYHKKLDSRFKNVETVVSEVRKWVDAEYAPALERGDSLSDAEKDHIASKMSEYLGISKKYCLGANLRVSEFAFFRELLRDEGLTIGRFDGRLVVKEETKTGAFPISDPSDDATSPVFISSINGYFADELQINTNMTYLPGGNVYPWQEQEGSYSETATQLRNLMARNPHFRVMYCCGYYDLACPFNATIYTVNHMGLDSEQRKRISFAYYPAGHMMYIEKSSRKKFHDDVKRFEQECLSGN